MKKVLITGAGGFVGKYLIDEFKSQNYQVFACDIHRKEENVDGGIKYFDMNILDKQKVEKVMEVCKPDYLVNLAAISSVGQSWSIPDKTMEVNVVGTLNLLEAIKKHSPSCKVLLIGSSEEYENKETPLKEDDKINANNPYGISKVAQENFANLYREKHGINIVCTRSFNHTGKGQLDNFVIPSFCKQVAEIENTKKPGKIYVGNLSAYRDFSDVKDVVKVYRRLLEDDNTDFIYNVGSGKAYKIEELLKYIISLSSQKIDIIVDKEKMRPIDTPYVCADNTKIQKYFDNTDIKDTIKEMYEEYLEKVKLKSNDDFER